MIHSDQFPNEFILWLIQHYYCHVLRLRQVLQATEFARIVVNQWTRDDVEREFGRPASIDHVANWPTDIMTYRWFEQQDMFFWIYLDQNNVVRRTEQGIEYHHDK